MKNYRRKIDRELRAAGYELTATTRHGDRFTAPDRPAIIVSRQITSQRLARDIIKKIKDGPN